VIDRFDKIKSFLNERALVVINCKKENDSEAKWQPSQITRSKLREANYAKQITREAL